MSEDLPIKISLDPTQAVGGAKKVTDEVAKTEAQAAKAKAAFEALGKSFGAVGDAMRQQTATALTNTAKGFDSLTEAIRREQAVLERIHGPAKQYEQDLKTLDSMHARGKLSTKEYADEVARLNKNLGATKPGSGGNGQLDSIAKNVKSIDFKQAAGAAAQAFGLLNEKLKITDSEFGKVAESAVKFGAMGAQVAGPWGAVAGALLGVALEGRGTFEVIDQYADSLKTAEQRTKELIEGSSTFKGQLAAIATGAHTLSEGLVLVTAHLQRLHDKTAQFSSLGPVLKAINDQLAAQKQILGEIDGPLTKYSTSTTALHMLWKTGAIDAIEYTHRTAGITAALASADPAMAAMTAQHAAGAAAAKAHADELKRYAEAVRKANTPQYDGEIPDAISGGMVPGEDYREVDVGGLKPMENKRATAADAVKDLVEWQKQNAEYQKQAAEEAKKQADEAERAKEAIVTMGDVMAGQLINASKSFSDNLVDGANGADVAWSEWGESMLQSLQKAITQALILKALTGTVDGSKGVGGYGGLFGALGFASGGTIYPSGPGSTDSMNVAFRKRPDETVHINTPSQEAAYQRGGQGGGSRTQTVNVQADDQRALLQGFDGPEGDRVFLNVVRRNPNAFAALLPRR